MVIPNFNATGAGEAYAWISVKGSAGKGVEAKIGNATYGVSVFTESGFTYIPVPRAGTYTLYNNRSNTPIATVNVTKSHEVYNAVTTLSYPFSRITDDQFIDIVNKLQTGDLLPSDLPWKAGDSRDSYLSDANTKSTIYIVDTTGNNGFTFADGTKPHYVLATSTNSVQDKFKETFKPFIIPAGSSFSIEIGADRTKSTIKTFGDLTQTIFAKPSYQDLYDLSDLTKYNLFVEGESGIADLWGGSSVVDQLKSAYSTKKCKKLENTDVFQLNNYSGFHFPTRDTFYSLRSNALESRLISNSFMPDYYYYQINNSGNYSYKLQENDRIIIYYNDRRYDRETQSYVGVGGDSVDMYLACI